MATTEEKIAHVEKYAAAHSAGDIDGIVELFAEDAVVLDPVTDPAYEGRDAYRAFFTSSHELSDSMELRITGSVRVAGDVAAVPLQVVSQVGGGTVTLDIIDVFTFGEDGLFTEMRAIWSPEAMQFS
jgi:steroid delta-isomerase